MDIELLTRLGVHEIWHNDPITLFTSSEAWIRKLIKLLHKESSMPLCYYKTEFCFSLLYPEYIVSFERSLHDHFVKIYNWKIPGLKLIEEAVIAGELPKNLKSKKAARITQIQLEEIPTFIKPYITPTEEK